MTKLKTEIIFGIRPVIEAVRSGKDIDKVLIKKGLKGALYSELISLIRKAKINHQYVPVERINRISKKNHQGIIAFISPISLSDIEQIIPSVFEQGEIPLILILDGITDMRNFGAIARTAECAGVHAIVVRDKGSAPISSDAVKTSAGAIYTIPVCRSSNITETLLYLKNCGLQIIAASERSAETYYNSDLSIPCAIIIGSEDKGICKECLKLSDARIKIPVLGNIESLNVSVATAILVYEAMRQRKVSSG